jgi:hypothetical protein
MKTKLTPFIQSYITCALWKLVTAYFGREVTKDACQRLCRCGASQSQIIPFRRFNLSK